MILTEHIYDMLILGGGPAGYTAALYAARAGFDTLLIERMSAGGQMALTGEIENYPGFDEGVDGFTLGMKMQNAAEKYGAKTEYDEVTEVDFSGKIKKVRTVGGEFFGKTVVISTGANPRELGVNGESELVGRGVHYCAHCDGRFYKDKTVAVIGGGNSAVSDALYLSRLAKKVYLIHRRDSLRAEKIFEEALKNADNIEILWNSKVEDFITDGRVTGLKLISTQSEKVSEIECDGVFVSIGRKPATDFLQGVVALDKNGYIIADESTKTGIDGVYAVGDVRTKPLRQIVTAAADGAVAVHFAEEYLNDN